MQGMLAPEEVEEALGTAEVRQIFRASRVGTIAGSHVTDGKITRGSKVRLVRDGTVVYDGEIASLRRFNDDVREVASGFDCGIVLRDYADVKEGDIARDLRDAAGRARARLVRRRLCARVCRRARDRAALSRCREPEGQAQGAVVDQGPAPWALRRGRLGDRTPGSVAALDADRGVDRQLAASARRAADELERWVIARCPDGVHVERLVASVEDLRQ